MATPYRELLFQAMAQLFEIISVLFEILFAVTNYSFLYVMEGDTPDVTPELTERELERLTDLQRYHQNPNTWNSNFIGDQTCANNAKSAYLRCAVNPCGPCEGCKDYQPGVDGGGGAL